MNDFLSNKIREQFYAMSIYKDQNSTSTLFAGRNLPSFVKDFIIKKNIDQEGKVDKIGLTKFLNRVIRQDSIKADLLDGEELTLLVRFTVYIDLRSGIRKFGIPDLGIKISEGIIPEHVYAQNKDTLVDGEMWGVIKICLMPDNEGSGNHVEMIDFKPFKPYKSVDLGFYKESRSHFTLEEWLDVLLSAMEYEASGFSSIREKLEFLTRLLIFVEPRLNAIELAPKGTGKSYVFGNLSKYGWLVSGGKVTRAKLFYNKQRQQYGIIKNHDYAAFDEIQTIVFQEPSEIQAALKSYLESGKTTIDDTEFTSECGLIIMGNIGLDENRKPVSKKFFDELPEHFRESALLDRFHCFIEGWHMPRIDKSMVYKGWTLNVEYFSEIMHSLRTDTSYGILFDELVAYEEKADIRDFNAVKKVTTAYMKLLFPHWRKVEDVDKEAFDLYCLQPAIRRRGIIKEQCHYIDPEFKTAMPEFSVK